MRKTTFRLSLLASLMAPAVGSAATEPVVPANPENMSSVQLQGVACILTGVLTAAGAVLYSGPLAAAATAADWAIPSLVIPAAAGGYAVGCTVGAITGPGAHWLYRRFYSEP
jgi:hypothetical protein